MLCLCFYVFFNEPGDSKHLGSAGQQADEYIAPGGKFFMFFMCLIVPMNWVSPKTYSTPKMQTEHYRQRLTGVKLYTE
jgi:hypothetical protein